MARLPDIPASSWAADQADLFAKQVKNYFPALEFEAATNDQQSDISPDWPYPGGQDNWEQAAQQAAEEEQKRQQEQLRQQQEAQIEAEAAQYEQQRQQAEAAASGAGIASPDQAFNQFQDAVGTPPGTGDNSSTTGAFEQGTPFAAYPPSQPAPSISREDMLGPQQAQESRSLPSALWSGISALPGQAADLGSNLGRLALGDNAATELASGAQGLAALPGAAAQAAGDFGDYTAERASELPGQATTVAKGIGQLALGDNAATELAAGAQGSVGLGQYAYDWAAEQRAATDKQILRQQEILSEAAHWADVHGMPDRTGGFKAVQDPTWQETHPDTAQEYDDLQGQLAQIIGGASQSGELGHAADEAAQVAKPLLEPAMRGIGEALAPVTDRVSRASSAIFDTGRGAVRDLGDAIGQSPLVQGAASATRGALTAADMAAGRGIDAVASGARDLASGVRDRLAEYGDPLAYSQRRAAAGPEELTSIHPDNIDFGAPDDTASRSSGFNAQTWRSRLESDLGITHEMGVTGPIVPLEGPMTDATGRPITSKTGNLSVISGPGGEPYQVTTVRNFFGNRENVPDTSKPLDSVFRVMSPDEYAQAQQRGFFQSDQRLNVAEGEGTVASAFEPATFYGQPNSEQVIVRLRADPADGWRVDPRDSYIKTNSPIPVDRIQAVMRYGTDEHGVPNRVLPVDQIAQDASLQRPTELAQDAVRPAPYGRSGRFQFMDPGHEVEQSTLYTALPDRATEHGRVAGTAIGGISGGITGAAQGDENTTWQERLRNAAAGATIGSVLGHQIGGPLAYEGTLKAARLVDDAIQRGVFDTEVFATHPAPANRIKAMLGLAAEGIPDDQVVHIPGQVQQFWKSLSEKEVDSLIPNPKAAFDHPDAQLPFDPDELAGVYPSSITAGQIRDWLGKVTTPSGWKQAVGDLLVDAMSGTKLAEIRAAERRADVTSVTGKLPEHLQGIEDHRPPIDSSNYLETQYGTFHPSTGVNALDEYDGVDPGQVHRYAVALDRVAQQLGVPRPELMILDNPSINAGMYSGRSHAPFMGVNMGMLDERYSTPEVEAILRHELTHAAERTADATGYPAVLNQLPEGLRVPARGPWKDRLATGEPEIPAGATDEERASITDAYNRAANALKQSQQANTARARISYDSQAKKAWGEYENLREGNTPEPATTEAPAPRTAPEPIPSEPTPEPAQPSAVSPTAEETAQNIEPGSATAPDSIDFSEPDALPEELDPKQIFEPGEAAQLIKKLSDNLVGAPVDRAWMHDQAINLMAQPKITGKYITQLLEAVGQKRAIPRYGDKVEQGRQYAQKFLQDNGYIAPAVEAADSGVGALSSLAPTPSRATDLPGRAANILGTGAQMGISGGIGAAANQELNPDDPNAALKGFAAGALVPLAGSALVRRGLKAAGQDIPETVGTLGLFGPVDNKVSQGLRNNVKLQTDSGYQQFANPTVQQAAHAKGAMEKAHDFWREKFVTGFADQLGVVQGLQNDLARIYKDQTGKALPLDFLAASFKRLNSNRAVEMDVQDKFQPHLETIKQLGIDEAHRDAYLLNLQDYDIGIDQGKMQQVPPGSGVTMDVPNLSRQFPGQQTFEKAKAWNEEFEAQLQRDMTPAQYQQFQDAIKGIHDFGRTVLDYLHDGGLIDTANYNDLRNRFPHYVPTRIASYLNDSTFFGKGKSLSVNSTTLRELTAHGTAEEAVSPVAALYAQAYEAHAAAQKNIVANKLLNMWEAASGERGLTGFTPPNPADPNLSMTERRVANFGQLFEPIPTGTTVKNEDNVLKLFRDGVPMRFEVSKAMGDLTKFPSPSTNPTMSGLMSAFRAAATSRNPAFISANALLDLSTSAIREAARQGGPQYIPKVLYEWGKVMGEYVASPSAWKDMATGTYRGDMAEALRTGGAMSGGHFEGNLRRPRNFVDLRTTFGNNLSQAEEATRQLTKNWWNIENQNDMYKVLKDAALFKWADTIGERIELAGRLPAYRLEKARGQQLLDSLGQELSDANRIMEHGQNAGLSQQQIGLQLKNAGLRDPSVVSDAMNEARQRTNLQATLNFRDTTLDFDKGGNITKMINQFIPFFNVGVQSIAELQRAVAEHPVAYTTTAALGVVGPMTVAEAWNQGDEKRRQDYHDVPQYLKDQGMVVMLPEHVSELVPGGFEHLFTPAEMNQELFPASYDKQGNRQPQFFHLRYRQLAPLAIATRDMLQSTLFHDDQSPESRRTVAQQLIGGFNQLSPIGMDNPADSFFNLLPPGLSTAGQLIMDRDTFHGNRRINTQYANERATPLSQNIASVLGPLTGDLVTPARTEFALRDFGSGMAGAYMGASQIPDQLTGDEPINLQNMPLVGGLANRWVKNSMGGIAQDAEANTYTDSADALLTQAGIPTSKWRPGPAAPSIHSVPLTRSEYGDYQTDLNRATDKVIQRVAQNAKWQALPPKDKEVVLQDILSQVHGDVADIYLQKIPADEQKKRLHREIDAGHLTLTGRR